MLSVEEAQEAILSLTPRMPEESVTLADCDGRVLASDVTAGGPLPPFDNSAVDGYAVRAADTRGCSADAPARLRELGGAMAGAGYGATMGEGTTVRIMTGALMPAGADAVVMLEDTSREPGGRVLVNQPVKLGDYIRRAGEDMAAGAVAVRAGRQIRPPEVAMLAAVGCVSVPVHRIPAVTLLTTGDEVVTAVSGEEPPHGMLRNSNGPALAAAVRAAGAELCAAAHVRDDATATEDVLRAAASATPAPDIILTAGGVSVGDRDFIRPALEKLGRLHFWGVAVKPGKPLAFGQIGDALFFGLPGNPVSALVAFELFVRPAIRKMQGRPEGELRRPVYRSTLTEAIAHTPGRREYVRAVTAVLDGRLKSSSTGAQGSGMIHSMTLANSLIVLEAQSQGAKAGDEVDVIMVD